MFSKRKSNNINGWIIIDKPAGITSTGVVNKIKRAFSAKKVGHAGTLDPDATGVLPIALGEATKTIPHIMDEIKSYHFCIAALFIRGPSAVPLAKPSPTFICETANDNFSANSL